jgi:hypothetical protein
MAHNANVNADGTQTTTLSTDSITVTVTLPASVVATGQTFNIAVTPTSQRASRTRANAEEFCPPTPLNSPRHRIPRFNLEELTPRSPRNNLNRGEAADDPFIYSSNSSIVDAESLGGRYGGRPTVDNNAEGGGNNGRRCDGAARAAGPTIDIGDDEEDLSAQPIYPVFTRRGQQASSSQAAPARQGAKYYVIMKGKKLGVFYDSW